MKRMSPVGSHYRQRMRTEPTDAQKTARIAMIRRRQRMSRGLGYPNAPAADDGDISNDYAFDADTGVETWQRPEPSPDYQAQFNPAIKDLERLSIEEEKLEERLKALNANIAAKEVDGTLNAESINTDEDVKEAAEVYKQLDEVRKEMAKVGNQVSSGIVTKTRVPVLSPQTNTWRNSIWHRPYPVGTIPIQDTPKTLRWPSLHWNQRPLVYIR